MSRQSRSPGPARRAVPRQSQVAKAPPVAVPVAPATAWKLILGGFGLLGAAAAVVWAVAVGLPRDATMGFATASSEAGFVVRQVEIDGARNQPRLSIYREVLEGGSDSMLLADLEAMRVRLIALPWVKDARIQRRWPDRLHITVIEREPAALWQHKGRLRLIDSEGVVLPAASLAPYAKLPLLVGGGARDQAPGLLKIVAAHPRLAGEMEAALWIGQRRWDLRMRSGETISLPEGPAAEAALMRFADIDRANPLLGRGFLRFDLRLPDKMVVRVDGDPGQPVKPRQVPKALPNLDGSVPNALPELAKPLPQARRNPDSPPTPALQPGQTARLATPRTPVALPKEALI
ncbi:MAG: cell division protein FtsQ/DivIB [Sandaracinobacteroides sp.]